MDFTQKIYKNLLSTLLQSGYSFLPFRDYFTTQQKRFVILRHDVDKLPQNSLEIAKMEAGLGVTGSFYFRMKPCSYDESVIRQIADLGQEVGYHYENMSSAHCLMKNEKCKMQNACPVNPEYREKTDKMQNGNTNRLYELAIQDFEENLIKLRQLVPVKTICMHGSPMSKYDSRELWKKYNYRDYGIIGEPYFDVDFNEVFYLTDTGRRWDGEKASVRDKVSGNAEYRSQNTEVRIHSTQDLISAVEQNLLPDKIMITVHPQRWTDRPLPWLKELVWQKAKNQVKRIKVKGAR